MLRLMVLLLLACPASSQTLNTDQIVERHIAALGGREAIEQVHSIVYRGMYHEPGPIPAGQPLMPHAYQAFMRPYYEAIGDPSEQHPDVREGFDGSTWEYYGDPGVAIRTVGAAASAGRHAADFLQDSLLDYRQKGFHLELQGTEKIGGRNAYKFLVTLDDGFAKFTFVDAESFLIVAERKSAPIHAFGQDVTTETRFSDFRRVHGVMFYFSSQEVEIATGKVHNEFRKVSVEVNTVTDAKVFSPPQFPRTPLQTFLEQLYAERADSVAVMHSYRLFRQAHPEVDTRSGVEFIGYQMAKMKDYDGAIALLTQNAADYPRSASSQFGLGRAYRAAGKDAEARAAFQQALQIDPTFKKATDGLNALR